MASFQKKNPLPLHVPEALQPIIQAFGTTSKRLIKCLILKSMQIIYGEVGESISREELSSITAIIMEVRPRTEVEAIYSAQGVVSHMIGLRKLSENAILDQKLALRFMRHGNNMTVRNYAS